MRNIETLLRRVAEFIFDIIFVIFSYNLLIIIYVSDWYRALAEQREGSPDQRLLVNCRRRMTNYVIGIVISLFMLHKYPHLAFVMIIYSIFNLEAEIILRNAILVSREEREAATRRIHRGYRRMSLLILIAIIVAVVITQNIYGIGEILCGPFPWAFDLSLLILRCFNNTVLDTVNLFTELFTVFNH